MNTLDPLLLRDVLAASLPPALGSLHVNYRYLLGWSQALAERRSGMRLLDFGCGPGQLVEAAMTLGLDARGADVFYGGEKDRQEVVARGLLGNVVREIRDGRIPFDDATFDLVVSNQVFEHVEDLDGTLAEVRRVMKPDGMLVALFPTREVVREAHCGVPFLHWRPRGERVAHALRWSRWGSGFEKEKKSAEDWAREAVAWVDRYVFYRTRSETLRSFEKAFAITAAEEHYLAYRLPWRPLAPLLRVPWAREASRLVCRRFNGAVLTARKRPS